MTSDAKLAELVERYRVCWEVWPELSTANHQQIGYELELYGSDRQIKEFEPCSTECERIRIGLGIIAAAILEAEENVTTEVMANTQRIEFSPARGNRPDVSLLIKILHRHDYDSPVDAQERTCLEKLKARLRSLGAFEHYWRGNGNHGEKSLVNGFERA